MQVILGNVPGTVQRKMDVIFCTKTLQFVLVYLDEIVIFSKFSKKHIDHGRNVVMHIQNAGVALTLKK